MPNHIHFIIHIVEFDTQHPVGAHPRVRPIKKREQPDNGQTNTNTNIPTVVQWYKTMTTNEYIRGVQQNAWPTFNGKLWQRNYWERVIRNENELNQIREYIQTNPMTWEQDKLFIKESGRQQNLTEIQHISGADTHVRKVKKREHPSTCATHFKKINSVHTLGQTRGSAPTEKSFQKTQAIT